MDEYLQYMKTLRSQMNDVEDQAEKMSAEEQMQITTIKTLQNDLQVLKSETKQLKEEFDLMLKSKGHICSQIMERQRKIALLETDSSTLIQTLELIQREKVNLSAKLVEKRTYYVKVAEEIKSKLQDQQEWIASYKHGSMVRDNCLGKTEKKENRSDTEGITAKCGAENQLARADQDAVKSMTTAFDTAKARLDSMSQMKSKLISEITKVKQSIELVMCRMNDFKVDPSKMDKETLEEELQALYSDKSGETEYLQSLQYQIESLKGISHMVKCGCGDEYLVEVNKAYCWYTLT